ncbi:MAG: CBS domain-containing protein [Treponemataceae bacterium]
MNVIVGHSNMDLDCIGSIVLAKYLFPDHTPIRSHLIHPVARNLLNLYENRLDFATAADLKGKHIAHVIVVDTRSTERIAEYFKAADISEAKFEVFDHHPSDGRDISGASIKEGAYGANTTHLGLELMKQGVFIAAEDATIALTGIYADTGNFTHSNVSREDFLVASYLLERGASLSLVKDFLVPLKEKQQVVLFHEIMNKLEVHSIRGHRVQTCYMELEEDTLGLGAVVERVFEVENGEILFGFFFFKPKGKLLIIARNKNNDVNLNELLLGFGGGGHKQAAAATVKTSEGKEFVSRIFEYLESMLAPAATARDIMTEKVTSIRSDARLLDAAFLLEETGHTGVPVTDAEDRLVGFLTLRDIMNGRKADMMHAPVSAYMARKIFSLGPEATMHEIDDILFEHNIGHLPIVVDGRLVGIVTRGDYLDYRRGDRKRKEEILRDAGVLAEA